MALIEGTNMRPGLPSREEIARLPEDGGTEFNRLIFETSPYLLQHARNPVDWYPWGEAARRRAREEDRPIFLSVGYSSCHWCHVMERESFEREDVAALLNAHYVAVKLDREERPDVDDIYMKATMMLTGRGGWPNSLWLTPDGRPFFAGTYFPREDHGGRAGFKTLLLYWADAWERRRGEIEAQADEFARYMRLEAQSLAGGKPAKGAAGGAAISRDPAGALLRALEQDFDPEWGGFGGAPKFPPHQSLRFLNYEFERTKNPRIGRISRVTLDRMARGGIHDHIGGGFHRYSTDAEWFLPHFEKMLYDNALLARNYTDAWRLTGEAAFREVAQGILDWALVEMASPEGGFYSALDADSEGEEGKFYLWTAEEIDRILGSEEGRLFRRVYGIMEGGNFLDEASGRRMESCVVSLPRPLDEAARAAGLPDENALRAILAPARARLLEARSRRKPPMRDEKILTSWNGLMIGALAIAGRDSGEARYLDAARLAADFLLGTLRRGGRLLRSFCAGEAKFSAYLDDYAFLADGLLDLHDATGESRWLAEARSLADETLARFEDRANGGFFFTSSDHEALLFRSKSPFDHALPSGNGVAARALLRLADVTGELRYRERAGAALRAFAPLLTQAPRAVESLILALAMYVDREAALKSPAPARKAASEGDSIYITTTEYPLTLRAARPTAPLRPGAALRLAFEVIVERGWHVQSHHATRPESSPLTLTLRETPYARLLALLYPEGEILRISLGDTAEEMPVYQGKIRIEAEVDILPTAPANEPLALEFILSAQACETGRCLAPQALRLVIPVQVAAQ